MRSRSEPAAKPGWSAADRSYPAFAVSSADLREKSVSYPSFGIPKAAARTCCAGSVRDDKPAAELEIYRPGGEFDPAIGVGLAARMGGTLELESAGVLDSKFGAVALLRQPGLADASSCLAFFKRIDDPALQFRAFPAGATACRRGARRSAACWIA